MSDLCGYRDLCRRCGGTGKYLGLGSMLAVCPCRDPLPPINHLLQKKPHNTDVEVPVVEPEISMKVKIPKKNRKSNVRQIVDSSLVENSSPEETKEVYNFE